MISIIVCTYNREKYLYDALQCIAKNNCATDVYEIILVNNNSTDNTEQQCLRFRNDYPEVNFHYFVETQQGLSFARNRGIEESHGDTLLFLDDDSFIQKNYLGNLLKNLENHPDADAFGGKITPEFESGETPKWLSKWTYSWISAINLGEQTTMFDNKKYPIGANMGIRKTCFEAVGLFNTQLGRSKKNLMGGEEKDLFDRLRGHGYRIYYFPDIEVHHVIPPSRTTKEYIQKLGLGIGMSERIRTLAISKTKYVARLFSELVKWGGTCALWVAYIVMLRPAVGNMLAIFRWNVTKGLIKKI